VSNGVLELAWPRTGIGIALNSADIEAAKQERWQVWTVSDVLDDLERFSKKIR
jgi:hypothetical protein